MPDAPPVIIAVRPVRNFSLNLITSGRSFPLTALAQDYRCKRQVRQDAKLLHAQPPVCAAKVGITRRIDIS
jgi:hypothetical protein